MKLLRVIAVLAALLPLPAMAASTASKIEGVGSATSPMGGVISAYCVSGCGSTTVSVVADTGAPTKVEGVGASGAPLGGVISINCVAGCSGGGGGSGTVTQVNTGAGLTGGPITTSGTISVTDLLGNGGVAITGTTYSINRTTDAATELLFTGTGASAWTLGAAVTGVAFNVTNQGTASITITATGNINGASTLVITAGSYAYVFNDGTTWWANAAASGSSGIPSIAGTANQITQSGSPGATTLSLPSTLIAPGSLEVTSTTKLDAALTYGGVTLSNAVTGTGNMVLSASPTLSGTTSVSILTAGTNISTPIVRGGSGATSSLIMESTSGAGSGDAIIIKTGTQVTAFTIDTNQLLNLGAASQTANSTATVVFTSLGPTGTACVIGDWFKLKDNSGNTRYMPLMSCS